MEEKKPRHAKQPSDDLSIPVAPKKEEKKAKMEKEKTPTASNSSNVNWPIPKTNITKPAEKRLARKLLFQELQKARTSESKKAYADVEEQLAEVKIALQEETKNRIRLEFIVNELLQRLDEETKRRLEFEEKFKAK